MQEDAHRANAVYSNCEKVSLKYVLRSVLLIRALFCGVCYSERLLFQTEEVEVGFGDCLHTTHQ